MAQLQCWIPLSSTAFLTRLTEYTTVLLLDDSGSMVSQWHVLVEQNCYDVATHALLRSHKLSIMDEYDL